MICLALYLSYLSSSGVSVPGLLRCLYLSLSGLTESSLSLSVSSPLSGVTESPPQVSVPKDRWLWDEWWERRTEVNLRDNSRIIYSGSTRQFCYRRFNSMMPFPVPYEKGFLTLLYHLEELGAPGQRPDYSFKECDVKSLSSHQLIEFLSLLLQEVAEVVCSSVGGVSTLKMATGTGQDEVHKCHSSEVRVRGHGLAHLVSQILGLGHRLPPVFECQPGHGPKSPVFQDTEVRVRAMASAHPETECHTGPQPQTPRTEARLGHGLCHLCSWPQGHSPSLCQTCQEAQSGHACPNLQPVRLKEATPAPHPK
ncbi:leukotriene A-4 hydrolase [Lates japonicus]|uniref:Leukotriene A-4 hydrolase n=1 Tax=Lates japonicus TaxID=270547 RepID=A0AAD3RKT7_LATJO|nr:leukotriene A-4 hydrolase [Lates japonicus]